MEAGLASTVVNMYGDGEGNTVKHFYAGSGKNKKKERSPKWRARVRKRKVSND